MERPISFGGMLLISGIALAGPKPATRAFSLSCAQVWEGVKAAVQSNYDVLSLNYQTRSGSFTTGVSGRAFGRSHSHSGGLRMVAQCL
jgi:hypothetical protein